LSLVKDGSAVVTKPNNWTRVPAVPCSLCWGRLGACRADASRHLVVMSKICGGEPRLLAGRREGRRLAGQLGHGWLRLCGG
jgi:hypothetical protein